MTFRLGFTAWAAMLFALAPEGLHVAADEPIRVENRIYFGNEKEPRVETTTIFLGNMVYDFLGSPAEVTVFDKARGRCVLLDLTRRVRTELGTRQVEWLTDQLQARARSQSDPFLRFLADPTFEEEFDSQAGQLTLSSEWMTYRVDTVPAPSETVSRQYREFCDWYSRLNTKLNPGSPPPSARLRLNAALDARGRLPREVVRTTRPKPGLLAKQITVRSEHRLTRGLSEADRDRVAQADQFAATFKQVAFEQYQDRIDE